jgi:hypothetical protein
VKRPTEAELDAVQNAFLFEGDIAGIDVIPRLADDVEDSIFGQPVRSPVPRYFVVVRFVTQFGNVSGQTLAERASALHARGGHDRNVSDRSRSNLLFICRQRAAIAQAFDEYRDKTCVRFVPRHEADFDYIYIKRNVAFGFVFCSR